MKAAELLAMYERVADAPDAVEKLRRFVLELAVRGKLVSQAPSEGSALDLLGQIAQRREQQEETDAVRRRSLLPEVLPGDAPYSLPATWCWVRFGSIVAFSAGRTPSRSEPAFWDRGEYPWVSIADMQDGETLLTTREKISQRASNAVFGSDPVPPGTLLMSFKLTIGKIVRLGVHAYHNEAIVSIRPHLPDLDEFLFCVLPLRAREGDTKGAIKGATLNRESIANILIPLPPLAEQQRIVAKVDDLMALCDQLEAARTEREAARDRLAAASLARLNAPDPDTFQADARFALNVLPALSARPDQVKQLRQTILNLAVRGKLVPQDPTDTRNAVPALSGVAAYPEFPSTWSYVELQHLLAEETRNGYARKPDDAPDGVPILRISAGTLRRDGIVAEEEHKRISGISEEARLQYGVRSGDLLACRFNGNKAFVGRLTLFTDYLSLRPIYPDKLIRVRVDERLASAAFVCMAGDSDLVRSEVERLCATTVGNWGISATNLRCVRIPLPPLAEQYRIVDKVNELTALCDQLEASLSAGEDARSRLLEAVLHEALDSEHAVAEVTAAMPASSANRPQQKTTSLRA